MARSVMASSLLIISLLGSVWQSFDIVTQYMKYETVSRIIMERPFYLDLPSLLVCRDVSNDTCTIGETFASHFRDGDLKWVKMPNPDDDADLMDLGKRWSKIQKFVSARRLIKQYGVCYHISLKRKAVNSAALFGSRDIPSLISVTFSDEFMGDMDQTIFYYLLPNNTGFHGPQYTLTFSMQNWTETQKRETIMTYMHIRTIGLPPPYDTNCRDYRRIFGDIDHSGHCVDRCMADAFMRNKYEDTQPFQRTYYEDEITDAEKSQSRNFGEEKEDWNRRAKAACSRKCRHPDCVKDDFSPRLVSQAGDDYVSVIVIGSTEPLLVSESSPKIAEIDIVTQMLSVISFWFALSPMAMFGIDIYAHLPIRKKTQSAARKLSDQMKGMSNRHYRRRYINADAMKYGNFQPFTGSQSRTPIGCHVSNHRQ